MSEQETIHGLACPRCGAMVPIPEGQVIVRCPYCELRSLVRGERGLQRYQVPRRLNRDQALASLQRFLGSSGAIAMNAAKTSSLNEAFVAYLPFWTRWARVMAWVFGQKKVRSGDKTTYKAREVKIAQDMTWNGAACDVGEFGVDAVPLTDQPLEPFDPAALHQIGMVFEPVGSISEARNAADTSFNNRLQQTSQLDRVAQVFSRFVRQRMGLVYYPLWVMRYLYRGRSFQVVVDGYSGQVLYGKAPGNSLYRAAVLVGGMAAGAFLAVDLSSLSWYLASQTEGDGAGWLFFIGLAVVAAGFGLMAKAYQSFRYGEQYEYRLGGKKGSQSLLQPQNLVSQIEEIASWIDQ